MMLRSYTLVALVASGAASAISSQSCTTISTELVVPTSTYTFASTAVVTVTATTPENFGTFTEITTISKTTTLLTLTPTATCPKSIRPHKTIYTTKKSQASARNLNSALQARASSAPCTDTVYTSTTSYGVTYTYLPATTTSTYTAYTAYTQEYTTVTHSGGKAYAIATAPHTASAICPATATRDARCEPSHLIGSAQGYGLEFLSDHVSSPGAVYDTITSDASRCCQLCANAKDCAGSAWYKPTGQCHLEFCVNSSTGRLACGYEAGLAYYDAGPEHPMAPGTGWIVANMCGTWEFGSAPPDDGS